jgi:TRAP-type C4-dicarboxylate transport system permease small subunit
MAAARRSGRSMIKIDACKLGAQTKSRPGVFSNLDTIVFRSMMLYYGWKMAAMQAMTQQKTIILDIPLVYLYALLPIMGTTMILRAIQVMYQDVNELRTAPSSEK